MDSNKQEYQRQYSRSWRKKNKLITFALTPEEYHAFEKQRGNLKTTTFIKSLALAGLPEAQKPVKEEVLDALKDHTFLVRNIANNVNQVAKAFHTTGRVDVEVVLQHLKRLDDTVQKFVTDQA